MSAEELLRVPIFSQGKFQFWLIGLLGGSVVVGGLLSWITQRLGVPERVSFIFPTVMILGTLGFILWYSVSSQGSISLYPDRMVIEARFRKAISLPRPALSSSLVVWRQTREALPAITAGPLLVLENHGQSIEIGTMRPELASGLQGEKVLMAGPHYIVSPEDFEQLIELLGLSLPAKGS